MPDVHEGCERFFRPGYNANLIDAWLPALDDVVSKLTAGARVADVGCGHGASAILMAQAFPKSKFVGIDYHESSIAVARERATQAGFCSGVAQTIGPPPSARTAIRENSRTRPDPIRPEGSEPSRTVLHKNARHPTEFRLIRCGNMGRVPTTRAGRVP